MYRNRVQALAYRKTRYQEKVAGKAQSVDSCPLSAEETAAIAEKEQLSRQESERKTKEALEHEQ